MEALKRAQRRFIRILLLLSIWVFCQLIAWQRLLHSLSSPYPPSTPSVWRMVTTWNIVCSLPSTEVAWPTQFHCQVVFAQQLGVLCVSSGCTNFEHLGSLSREDLKPSMWIILSLQRCLNFQKFLDNYDVLPFNGTFCLHSKFWSKLRNWLVKLYSTTCCYLCSSKHKKNQCTLSWGRLYWEPLPGENLPPGLLLNVC